MATMETRSIESPDEPRPFQADGHMDVVTLGGVHVGENLLTGLAVVQGREADRWNRVAHHTAHQHLCPVR